VYEQRDSNYPLQDKTHFISERVTLFAGYPVLSGVGFSLFEEKEFSNFMGRISLKGFTPSLRREMQAPATISFNSGLTPNIIGYSLVNLDAGI
jgi:hypothetical protein